MDCPKCGGKGYCKDGIVQGWQRYLCKGCRYRILLEKCKDYYMNSGGENFSILAFIFSLIFTKIIIISKLPVIVL